MENFSYQASFRRRKKKRILPFIVIGIIVVVLFAWYKYSQYQYYLQTPVDPSDTSNVAVVIKKWSAASGADQVETLAQKLKDQDLILDADTFKLYVKLNQIDRKLVAGRFLLNRSMTIPDIIQKITDIKNGQVVLTIPEGATLSDIDKKLAESGLIQSGEFIQATKNFNHYENYPFLDKEAIVTLPHPLEGFLFPDTYFLNPGTYDNQSLIQLLLKTFQKKMAAEIQGQDAKTIFENVVMASMVEKEVKTEKDRPIVAGILWKRLKENWQLGVDATLLYLKNDRSINTEDLTSDSPYNTRRNRGLPPGPISNPGLESLQAAFHPESSQYYYYLTKPGSGEVVYAVTNDEQNNNREKYLNR